MKTSSLAILTSMFVGVVGVPAGVIQSVPYTSWTGYPDPGNPVIGVNLNQHPGAFYTGMPDPGTFFIGVFDDPIDTSNSHERLCLWETTGSGWAGEPGPMIQLGYWDGTAFSPQGSPQQAFYSDTGLTALDGDMALNRSCTPLSDFGITIGSPEVLNAVQITAVDGGHNQVIAIAAVPEPPTLLSTGLLLVSLGLFHVLNRMRHCR